MARKLPKIINMIGARLPFSGFRYEQKWCRYRDKMSRNEMFPIWTLNGNHIY